MPQPARAHAARRTRTAPAAAAFVALGVLCACGAALAAPKTDILLLRNGDRITGEVRDLERGRLTFMTDDIGLLEIEWDKIASVTATATFEIETLVGDLIYGSLQPGPYAGAVTVETATGLRHLDALALGRISRLGATLWGRIDGSIDLGASFASSNNLFTLDLSAMARYERPGYEITTNVASTVSTQPDAEDTRRGSAGLSFLGRLPDRWFYVGEALGEQNQELGFDIRGSLAGGFGRYFVKSHRDDFQAYGGLSFNRETPVEGDITSNLEAVLSLGYNRFSYDFPKVDIYVNLSVFENLTDTGRTRAEFEAKIRREMLKDFYVTLRGYESYDSRPATVGSPNHDYGLTFAFGWSF